MGKGGGSSTKDEMLEIAIRLLRTGGYEALNFGTIAGELGVTRASVHHYFGNKENLALEALSRYEADFEERFSALSEMHPGDFPTAMAKTHEGTWRRLSENGYAGFCAAAQLIADRSWIPEGVGHRASAYYERLIGHFSDLIEESQEAGAVRDDRPAAEIAREALSVHLGVAMMAMSLPGEREPDSSSRRRMREWLLALAPRSEEAG